MADPHPADADRRPRPRLHLLEIVPPPPADRPPAWLSRREREVFNGLRVDKRRGDWLAGRRVGKAAVVAALAQWGLAATEAAPPSDAQDRPQPREAALPPPPPDPNAARLEILADDDGAPAAWLDGRRLQLATPDGRGGAPGLSLTHSGRFAAALVTPPGVRGGCDLEQLQSRSEALVAGHFTPAEIARIRAAASSPAGPAAATLATNLTWSAKEAALKLLRTGLRRDTRSVQVEWGETEKAATAEESSWHPLQVTDLDDPTPPPLPGWWLTLPDAVLTVVTDPAAPAPAVDG